MCHNGMPYKFEVTLDYILNTFGFFHKKNMGWRKQPMVSVKRLNPNQYPYRYKLVFGADWIIIETTAYLQGDPESK